MVNRNSKDAVAALNGLQSNVATVQMVAARTHDEKCLNVEETERYLNKIGVSLDDLDGLSVIHVTGTKGKVKSTFNRIVARCNKTQILPERDIQLCILD